MTTKATLTLLIVIGSLAFAIAACARGGTPAHHVADQKVFKVQKSDAEWKKQLTPEQFRILREQGTERAFTGKYWDHKGHGVYKCAGCGQPLFSSDDKFKSGTGWPSYTRAIDDKAVDVRRDNKFGMVRTEILCSRCGGHLGHVFDDGPAPTGQRYCVNSASLLFDNAPSTPAKPATAAKKGVDTPNAKK